MRAGWNEMVRTTVRTRQGSVRGLDLGDVVLFAGLAYAVAPDVSRPRFSMPAAVPEWSGVREATSFGPVAPQPRAAPGYLPGEIAEQAEECRTCNVWAPSGFGDRLPVLVFVHGGAFLSGSGSSLLYRGERLARSGAVVVTFNYRLGALGFLAHPVLADPVSGGCGNWGLSDQLALLGYVRDNAAVFGGDPDNVTVFGESAGAMSVCDLLGMPAARGLFRRAIVESGAAVAHRLPAASQVTEVLSRALGIAAPGRSSLAAVPLEDLLEAQATLVGRIDEGLGMPLAPVVDGGLLAVHPAQAIAAGAGVVGADLLGGTNRDEFRFFTFLSRIGRDLDADRLESLIDGYLESAGVEGGPSPAAVVAAYREARSARGAHVEHADLLDAFGTDWIFRIPQLRLLEAHRRHGARVYSYLFDWESPFGGGSLGSCHALELPFVFGSVHEPIVGLFTGAGDDAFRLSGQIRDAWVAFAGSGDPSTEGLGPWPAYEPDRRSTMVLGADPRVVERPQERERAFWEGHLGDYGVGGPIEGAEPVGVAFLERAGDRSEAPKPGT